MLVLSTSMYPNYIKTPGLIRVNRVLQVLSVLNIAPHFLRWFMPVLQAAWKEESRYMSRIYDWLFDIWCDVCAAIYLCNVI